MLDRQRDLVVSELRKTDRQRPRAIYLRPAPTVAVLSEEGARLAVESTPVTTGALTDDDLIRFYAQCFDRPAFQDPFEQEGSIEAFDRAIEDTITALSTGCLRARDGAVLQQGKGKAYLTNPAWRGKLDTVVDILRAIRSRYDLALKEGTLHVGHELPAAMVLHQRPQPCRGMDETRAPTVQVIAELCREAGVTPPCGPRLRPTRW